MASRTTISWNIGERQSYSRCAQYRVLPQFISRLPILDLSNTDRDALASLAQQITGQARARYRLHQETRHRLLQDFGTPDRGLNQKLTAWWDLAFAAFRAELQKVFKRDIPVRERDEWETWLMQRQAAHRHFTAEIMRLARIIHEWVCLER